MKKKIIENTPEAEIPRQSLKRTVSDPEQERLEKIALRTLKRLEREDKVRRLNEERIAGQSSSSASIDPDSSTDRQPPRVIAEIDVEEQENQTEGPFDSLREELLGVMSQEGLAFSEFKVEGECLMVKPFKGKSQEFNMKEATPEEVQGFKNADQAEWKTILDLKAVKVLSLQESRDVRQHQPHRILQSRFVRRKKPMPGLGKWKFKSRW